MKKAVSILCPEKWKVNRQVKEFLTPDFVYLPISKEAKMLTKKRNVYKGDALYEYQKKTYYSPISGKIEKIVSLKQGEKENYFLKILNDFQENDHYQGVEHTTVMLTNDLKERIRNYHHHFFEDLKNCDTLVLFGLEKEPFLASQSILQEHHMDEICLFLDTLASCYHIDHIFLYFQENDQESIEAAEKILNVYPKMQMILLPPYVPYGNRSFFRQTFLSHDRAFLLSSYEVFDAFYELIKLRKKDFLYLTITGDSVKNPQVVKVKIGTVLEDVIKHCVSCKKNKMTILKNGLLAGEVVEENLVLTEDVHGIFLMKTKEIKEEKCIFCGKCNAVCPVGCNPYKMVQTKGKFHDSRCISCGLCSYVCPSHISILEKGDEK